MTWLSNPLSVGALSISWSGLGGVESVLGASFGTADFRRWDTLPCFASGRQMGTFEAKVLGRFSSMQILSCHGIKHQSVSVCARSFPPRHTSRLFAITFAYSGHFFSECLCVPHGSDFPLVIAFFKKKLYNSEPPQHCRINQGCFEAKKIKLKIIHCEFWH